MKKKKQKGPPMSKDIDKQITIGMERNDGTANQDPGDINGTTECNTLLQANVSNTPDTNSNESSRNSSLDTSIDKDSDHKVDDQENKVDADSIQNNINQESNTTCGPAEISNTGNGHEMNKGNDSLNANNEIENNANFDPSKSRLNEQMGNIIERNNDTVDTEIKCKDDNNETNTEKNGEISCPKEDNIQNEQSCNKETGPDTNTIEEKQVFSDAKCETMEETNKVDIIIQAISEILVEQKQSEIEKEPPCGTEPVGNTTEDQRGVKQGTQDNSGESLKLNDPTNETDQTTNKAQSEDEIYDLPTLNNTEDTSAAIQNGGDQNNCSIENIVQPPPNVKENSNAGDIVIQHSPNNKENPEEINSGDRENQNIEHNTPSSACENTTSTYRRCCCYCCYCGRLRCYRCCCQACCRPNDNTTPVCQNCSRPNVKEPHTSSVNEPTNPVCHSNCQNDSRPNVNETTHPVSNINNRSGPNNEPSASVSDGLFRPIHTSSPIKSKSNEQNELEATPSKRRKLFQNEDPNESQNGNNNDTGHIETVCERNNGKPRENDDDKRNSTMCEICRDKRKTRCERCCYNTKCETCERHNGYDAGYCEQNCRLCRPRNKSRCDYWANNKATQTNEEYIVNPNEKSTQTCFADVRDEGRTLFDDTQVIREASWTEDNKNNPRQTGRRGKQHSDDLLYRDDTQPPVKKKKQNKDMRQYEQYHNNAYLNYYVRLFREERFQGIRASEVAKYAGYEWRSRMSEKEKRPYYEMKKMASPKNSGTKNKKTNKWMME
uniref:Uncharacterized protein n=1 Tax=Cacopsylla melanoneura TaxID=428564 RepID=A0A8D8WJG7_9HEMI